MAQAPDGRVEVGENIVVGPQGASIGRGSENTWRLADEDRLLSRVHLTIALQGDGFVLADLSTNGVFVNGAQLVRGDCCVLQDGDLIRVGDYLLRAEHLSEQESMAVDSQRTRSSGVENETGEEPAPADAMFETDPEQWLMAQLQPASDPSLAPDTPADLSAALAQLFGEKVRHCSDAERLMLVTELCGVVVRTHPDISPEAEDLSVETTASAYERILATLKSLE